MKKQQNIRKKNQNPVSQASKSMVFNHKYGQNILINQEVKLLIKVLHKIVEKSCIKPTDIVVEIGPGTGNLTQLLLQKAKKVICYEIDPRMVSELTKRFKYGEYGHKFELIQGDFLRTDLPYFDLCVANCPYQISSSIVFKLLSHRPLFRHAVLMFQQEFAMRLVAKPGNEVYCRLSVNVQLMAETQHLLKVGRNNFRPPPKVESSVVRIQPKNPFPKINFNEWDGLLRICFIRKNKQLGAIYKQKKILALLEKNYMNFQKLKATGAIENVEETPKILIDEKQDMDEEKNNEDNEGDTLILDWEMEEEQTKDNSFKEKIMNILSSIQFNEKRSSKLDVDDFLKLLHTFNQSDIHFR